LTPTNTSTVPRTPEPTRQRSARRWRPRRILLIVLIVALVAVAATVGTALGLGAKYDHQIARVDPFAGLTHRPAAGPSGAQNILIVGSDTHAKNLPSQATAKRIAESGGQRSDVLMLAHLTADHKRVYLISIPRDSYVNVPAAGPWQGGRTKINAAFAYGGLPLVVRTVEGFTGVRIDHVALMEFVGFRAMTDAIGGVDVKMTKTVYDPRTKRTYRVGFNHLDGAAALDFVRQRHGLPGGDFDREKRQQQFILALVNKAVTTGTLANPKKLNSFLDATSKTVIVDKQLSLTREVLSFKGIRTNDLNFITTPHKSDTVRTNVGDVVAIDHDPASALFDAVAKDRVTTWLQQNPQYRNNVAAGG
jgi:LCP family protein required for cell wall assembly